jgi:universal stress protein A
VTFPEKILLAVDGSPQARQATSDAADLAIATGASLDVLHVVVITPWTAPRVMRDDQLDRLRADGRKVLEEHLSHLAGQGLPVTGEHLRLGRVVDEVLRLRDELGSDLVVVGNRGTNAFSRILLGSDAKNIMLHAPCPVLVVRDTEASS